MQLAEPHGIVILCPVANPRGIAMHVCRLVHFILCFLLTFFLQGCPKYCFRILFNFIVVVVVVVVVIIIIIIIIPN